MSEFKEFELKFDEWWEENYMNVSADRTEAFDIYSLGLKHQQAKVGELQTLYTQQGINMLKMQKMVDLALEITKELRSLNNESLETYSESIEETICDIEQALKGEG